MKARRSLLLVVFVAAFGLLAAPALARPKRCGRILVIQIELKAKVDVHRGPVSCEAAKRLIYDAFSDEGTPALGLPAADQSVVWRVDGWRCEIGLGASETFCGRGRRQVDGSTRTDDGWDF
jgi:hypothetical protein